VLAQPDDFLARRELVIKALLKNSGLALDFTDADVLDFVPTMFHGSWAELQRYTETLKERTQKWPERRIVFVGEEGVGKSTLVCCSKLWCLPVLIVCVCVCTQQSLTLSI
jgi:hypothetical protein